MNVFSGAGKILPVIITIMQLCLAVPEVCAQHTPALEWAGSLGGRATDRGDAITTDASGNVYTAGRFTDTADFDPGAGAYTLISNGDDDIYISKLDSAGHFVWAKQIGGPAEDVAAAIVLDSDGNIYVAGEFKNTVDFDPGPGIFNMTTIPGNTQYSQCFILKLDKDGNFLWAKQYGAPGKYDHLFGFAISEQGDIYATGRFMGVFDFGNTTLNAAGGSYDYDMYVARLDKDGNFIWVKQIGGKDIQEGNDIALDETGYLYITGRFADATDFDPGPASHSLTSSTGAGSLYSTDAFVLKLDTTGNFIWARQFSGPGVEWGTALALDKHGYIYATGYFQGADSADFGPEAAGAFKMKAVPPFYDIYLVKLDTAGALIRAGQISGPGINLAADIVMEATGEAFFLTGNFTDSSDFDPGTGTHYLTAVPRNTSTAGVHHNIFVVKLDTAAGFIWAHNFGYPEGLPTIASANGGNAIAADASGHIYVTGSFSDTVNFHTDEDSTNLLVSYGTGSNPSIAVEDAFVLKLSDCILLSGRSLVFTGPDTLCLNDTNTLFIPPVPGAVTYKWELPPGWAGSSTTNRIRVVPDGAGTVSVQAFGGCDSTRVFRKIFTAPPPDTLTRFYDISVCFKDSALLKTTDTTAGTYHWNTGAAGYKAYVTRPGVYVAGYRPDCYTYRVDSFRVTFGTGTLPQLHHTNYGCAGPDNHDTAFIVSASGDTTYYTYRWYSADDSLLQVAAGDTGDTLVRLAAGRYHLRVTAASGCDTTLYFTIGPSPQYEARFITDTFLCERQAYTFRNTSTGNMNIWHWDFGDGNFSGLQSPSHSYAAPGNYRVALIAATGAPCYDTFYRDIVVDTLPVLNFIPDKRTLCPGDTVIFSPVFTTGLTTLRWRFGDGQERTGGLSGTMHAYERTGVYPVTIAGHSRACPDTAFTDTITVYPPPPVSLGNDTSLCPGDAPLRLANLQAGEANDRYRWSTGAGTETATIHEPGIYWLQVTSENGCTASDSITIHRSCYLDIPNVFTPNGDGANDYFYPRGLLSRGVTELRMQVFNRWGQLVYETGETGSRGWDGTRNGQPVQEGVYIYLISAGFRNGAVQRYQGNVTLLR